MTALALAPVIAAQTASNNVVTSCVSKLSGVSRIVSGPAACNAKVENVVQWNKQGLQGSKGDPGPEGTNGAAGPAGGNVLIANNTLPAAITGKTLFALPLTGTNMAQNQPAWQTTLLPAPSSCSSLTFSLTALDVSGTSTAVISLNTVTLEAAGTELSVGEVPLCNLTASSSTALSCSTTVTMPSNVTAFSLWVVADQDFQGSHFLTKVTCL